METEPVKESEVIVATEEEKPESKCCGSFFETISDQDFQQKTGSYIAFSLELYRVLMGTMLLLFVPQKCGDHLCGVSDVLSKNDNIFVGNLSVNFVTFAAFFAMYIVEIRRETKMISYLEVNKEFASDNDAVGEALELLPDKKRDVILNLDGSYQMSSYIAMICFIANSIFSGITIYDNFYDSKTTTVFVTNLLFLASKLGDVYGLANTDKHIFYSAYLKDKVQYNYADPDKIKKVDNEEPKVEVLEEKPKEEL
tara:strand:+ start:9141 stop:9902 length:762 start_codon:yes stop_codon:yes gene_type:complete